jgi:hypothetical protein
MLQSKGVPENGLSGRTYRLTGIIRCLPPRTGKRAEDDPNRADRSQRLDQNHVGNVAVAPGVPFLAANDWFNNVVVVVENVSTKKIVLISGQLRFPETGDATAENLAVLARIAAGAQASA